MDVINKLWKVVQTRQSGEFSAVSGFCGALLILALCSCEQFLQVSQPPNQITQAKVFENQASASAALTGIYTRMMSDFGGFASGGPRSVTLFAGLSSDELINYSPSYAEFYNNSLSAASSNVNDYLWSEAYQYIYTANALLENIESSAVGEPVKTQLKGEAQFIRAFCYFYLVNLFGQVPLLLSTDYKQNAVSSRYQIKGIYEQIITDLLAAESMLPQKRSATDGRVRPVKAAATAMLARVYLYDKQWEQAQAKASALISAGSEFSLPSLSEVFLKDSPEAIWQLMPVRPGYNTNEANLFLLKNTPLFASLRATLPALFGPQDRRRSAWIDSITVAGNVYYFPTKYKAGPSAVLTEYSVVLRLAEQYLIRAESRANLGDISGAVADVNALRARAGALPIPSGIGPSEIERIIEKEWQLEFFAEWGHRWLNLKRTGRAAAVLSALKGASWQDSDVFYPIPQKEINNNPLIIQNDGY
ncbi:RagB/SusD family nutrient uptake outer membrane protein [Dyadobacter jiangsuensis]